MGRVLGQFAVLKAGYVKKMFVGLKTLLAVNSVSMADDVIHVIYNQHFSTEQEVQQVIMESGFSVQPLENAPWE